AWAGARLSLRMAHVEAGLRSFDRSMPEELNRVLVDAVSGALFCPSDVAVGNLAAEGITDGVHVVGDVMADAARLFGPLADRFGHPDERYVLATVHREANTRQPALGRLVTALSGLGGHVSLPLHPRTRVAMSHAGLEFGPSVEVRQPASYLEFTALLRGADALLTDSGGAQKEAYFHRIPCVTLRET